MRLSRKLLQYRSKEELLETLLHELIHAYLFLTKDKYERKDGTDGHGPDFIKKMVEINNVTGLKLSVYHTFHDEVDRNREHVWLCNGKCGKAPPYFGVVKRARNMPPGTHDWWFEKHKRDCGGTYIKIIEPIMSEKQAKENKEESKIKEQNSLDSFFKPSKKRKLEEATSV